MSEKEMSGARSMDIPYGTLDLLILKSLETMGRLNGYALARRIEQVAGESVQLSQGAVYPALIRLQQEGWIRAELGVSETNRQVKFYSLTAAGRKQLRIEVANWEKGAALVARFLQGSAR
ncbi:MAG: PadR family transcriptional regulator [Bryobacteraceae bacterium]